MFMEKFYPKLMFDHKNALAHHKAIHEFEFKEPFRII